MSHQGLQSGLKKGDILGVLGRPICGEGWPLPSPKWPVDSCVVVTSSTSMWTTHWHCSRAGSNPHGLPAIDPCLTVDLQGKLSWVGGSWPVFFLAGSVGHHNDLQGVIAASSNTLISTVPHSGCVCDNGVTTRVL